jgi:predicted lipoprotein with Yx(FWY)xxD motif
MPLTEILAADAAATPPRRRRGAALAAGAAGAAMLAAPLVAPGAAAAQPRPTAPAGKAAVVVKIDPTRGKFKDVLVTTKGVGLTLYEYTDKKKPCTGSCLDIWPPLYMPKGDTTPEGVAGLGTIKLKNGRLQVTYEGQALYTYFDDGGDSTSGVGIVHWVIALEK